MSRAGRLFGTGLANFPSRRLCRGQFRSFGKPETTERRMPARNEQCLLCCDSSTSPFSHGNRTAALIGHHFSLLLQSNFLGTSIHLNEETLGGHLKAGISQFLALEMTKNNGRDHKAITKYLPWLYCLPSLQQG